jgi:hypothetical protein
MDLSHLLTSLAQCFSVRCSPGSCLWRFGPLGGHGREQHFSFLSSLVVSSARRQLQLSFSLGCGYFLHSFVCCPASQYLRDCGRVLEQIGALMAPAAAAPIAGCPCGRAAAAPPFILYNKGTDHVNGWLARCRSLNMESLVAYGTSQGTAATELLVGPSGALPRCAVLGTARSAAGFLRRSLMWCSLGRLWPHPMSPPIGRPLGSPRLSQGPPPIGLIVTSSLLRALAKPCCASAAAPAHRRSPCGTARRHTETKDEGVGELLHKGAPTGYTPGRAVEQKAYFLHRHALQCNKKYKDGNRDAALDLARSSEALARAQRTERNSRQLSGTVSYGYALYLHIACTYVFLGVLLVSHGACQLSWMSTSR